MSHIGTQSGLLPEEAYKEFSEIYKKEFGIQLSEEEVVKKANDMLSLFRVFTKRAKEEQIDIEREVVVE